MSAGVKPRPTGVLAVDVVGAHAHSIEHRDALLRSERCGCFYCLRVFGVDAIRAWTDADADGVGLTALCPFCGIDSVLGSASGFPVEPGFLRAMRRRWMR